MKVLIIRFSSIGDIVLTSPVLRCIKQQQPGTRLHFLTKASFRPVVEHNPYIDQLHLLQNDDLQTLIEQLKAERFDAIIDLHHNLRTARVKQALGVKSYTFDKLNIRKWLLVNARINLMPDESIVDRYFATIRPLGVHNDGQGLDYFIPDSARIRNEDIPFSHWAGYVACVIGGSFATKQLPAHQWVRFLEHMPYPAILLGGPEDREPGRQIAACDPQRVYNACGKFSINESADLVQRARVVVSNDTGLMHVAAAFKKPLISLWGNTAPELGLFPYYGFNNLKTRIAPQSVIMERKGLSCHPCSKLGYKKCPRGHFKCMNELDMEAMAARVVQFWK